MIKINNLKKTFGETTACNYVDTDFLPVGVCRLMCPRQNR